MTIKNKFLRFITSVILAIILYCLVLVKKKWMENGL